MLGEGFKAAMGGWNAAGAEDANLFKVHETPWVDNEK
jgi:hypothetical protein